MAKQLGDYFLVFWHKTGSIENGWDLVWAIDANQARAKYNLYHHAPIHRILSRTWDEKLSRKEAAQYPGTKWDTYSRFADISSKELEQARSGLVVELEVGT